MSADSSIDIAHSLEISVYSRWSTGLSNSIFNSRGNSLNWFNAFYLIFCLQVGSNETFIFRVMTKLLRSSCVKYASKHTEWRHFELRLFSYRDLSVFRISYKLQRKRIFPSRENTCRDVSVGDDTFRRFNFFLFCHTRSMTLLALSLYTCQS
jgi:hypothetical protein